MKLLQKMPAVFVYRLLGVKQGTFHAWLEREFIEPTHETKEQRNKYFNFNEVCWACVFFFFARAVKMDHKTILTWRSRVLTVLKEEDNFLELSFGKKFEFQGWASQKTNSLLHASARYNRSVKDFQKIQGDPQENVATITVNLKIIREFVEAAIEKYE